MSAVLRFSLRNVSKSTNHFFERSKREKLFRKLYTVCRKKRLKKWMKIQNFSTQESSQNIVKSPLGDVIVPQILLHEKIFLDWSLWDNKVALQCGLTGRKYKFKEVRKNSEALAAAFQNKLKLEKGDKITIILPNCPEYPIIVLAASQVGVIPTIINPLYTPYEIQWHMEDCQATLIITHSNAYEKCFQVVQSMKKSIPIAVVNIFKDETMPDGAIKLLELFDSGSPRPVTLEPNDVALIPYSSGTTGSPKGVLLTHKNIVSNLTQISHPETVIMEPTTRFHQDVIMGILPMFHVYGLMIGAFFSLKDGCQVITLPKFDPVVFVNNIFRNKVCILYVVPPIIKLLTHERVKRRYLKSIQYLINAASPLIIQDAHILLEKCPHIKIGQGYGMTEASPVISHTSTKRMQKLTSIGIPIASSQFKVANLETGEALGKGQRGELRVFGPQIMKGYLNRPEESENAFDSEGYLKTGDIVYYDDDGDFFVVERLKDLIKVKGFQVVPAELEEVLRTHPQIKDAAVVGVPDPVHGEVPKAFVILEKGAQISEEEVDEFIKKKLSHYKQLRGGVVFVENFPRNNVGKVIRRALRDM